MRVIIQMQEDAGLELHNQLEKNNIHQPLNSEIKTLIDLATEIDVRIEPVHPNATNLLLVPFFMIAVTDRESAEKIIARLKRFTIVEAAYFKPDEHLP